jgi:hypothetical protein
VIQKREHPLELRRPPPIWEYVLAPREIVRLAYGAGRSSRMRRRLAIVTYREIPMRARVRLLTLRRQTRGEP